MKDSVINGAVIRTKALAKAAGYVAMRALGAKYVPLHAAAVKCVTLSNAFEVEAITPFYWDEHLSRIRGARTYGSQQVISQDLNRKTFSFKSVNAYSLKDAVLLDGSVYSNGYRHELRSTLKKRGIGLSMNGPLSHQESGVLVSTCAGSAWWGHWVEDEVPLQMLAQKFGRLVSHNRDAYRDEEYYRELFGLEEPDRYGIALFDELIVIDEHAQNPNKTRRYSQLRSRISHLKKGFEKVFLSRGVTGDRRILENESDIRKRLESEGFHYLDIETAEAHEVVEKCRGAKVVVSVEGSHMAPLLYLLDDYATMIILSPPNQVHTTIADIGVFCRLTSGMFICEPVESSDTSFTANPEELVRFIGAACDFSKNNIPRLEKFVDNLVSMDETRL